MRQAKQLTKLLRNFIVSVGPEAVMNMVPLPPAPNWFVQGPRGGVYVATGWRERNVSDHHGDDWMRGVLTVEDRSEGVRYVRPGSLLYREWEKDARRSA